MIDEFAKLIPDSLLDISGTAFYSGRTAFGSRSKIYILGLNPGGSPIHQATETVRWHTANIVRGDPDWSAYRDESWQGNAPGTHGMQPGVLRMIRSLNLEPHRVPASSIIFARTSSEADLRGNLKSLAEACWPFHDAVIERLGVGVVLCFGGTAGAFVRKRLGATECVDQFVEMNNRRWTSRAYRNTRGMFVVEATHPSRAVWTTVAADPSPLVKRILDSDG
jgi:hypothetical protein